MKILIVLLLASSSVFAQDNCALIDSIYLNASYIDQIKQDRQNSEITPGKREKYKSIAGISTLYAASYASFKMGRIGRKSIYNTKQQIKAAQAADDLVSVKSLKSYLKKSKVMRKSFKVLGWAFLVGGTMHLAKSYFEADFEDASIVVVNLDDSSQREDLCKVINSDKSLRNSYKEYALKLFIARSDIEEIINQEKVNISSTENNLKIFEILESLDKPDKVLAD